MIGSSNRGVWFVGKIIEVNGMRRALQQLLLFGATAGKAAAQHLSLVAAFLWLKINFN